MVYRGRPSRACGRCRLRRLKCDEGSPLCSACLRARVQSCEYRDALSLGFCDQTEKVTRKAQHLYSESTSVGRPRKVSPSSPHEGLACPPSQLARGYMYTHYMTESHYGGYLPCLVTLAECWPNSALPAAITAVGLAALANMRQCPQVMLEARRECNTAISLTKSVLNDPDALKRDDVLATVVMLGMFEVMTCSDAASIARWSGHVDGATRLIEVRGEDQLDRPEGLALFTHLRVAISTNGIYRERYSSPMITHLTQKAKNYRSSPDPVDDLATTVFRLNDFCAGLKDGKYTKPSDIIRTALNLDGDLVAALLDSTSASSSYSVIRTPDSTGKELPERTVWGDTYHVYTSIAASSMWNNYRSARTLLREIIIDALRQTGSAHGADDEQHQALVRESCLIGLQLVNDVCASVPFHLDAAALTATSTPTCKEGSTTAPVGAGYSSALAVGTGGAITLLWPLLIAANSGFASSGQRDWIIRSLERIGRETGIGQARAMAQLLRGQKQTRTWLTTVEEIGGLDESACAFESSSEA